MVTCMCVMYICIRSEFDMTCIPIKKGALKQNNMWSHQDTELGDASTKQETARLPENLQKLGENHQTDSSLSL
jgi:hypothetical protein